VFRHHCASIYGLVVGKPNDLILVLLAANEQRPVQRIVHFGPRIVVAGHDNPHRIDRGIGMRRSEIRIDRTGWVRPRCRTGSWI